MIHWIKVEIVFWKERKRKELKILHLLVLKYEKWNLFSTVFQYEVWKYSLRCSGSTLVRLKAAKCSSWHAMQTSWCKLQTDWKGLKGSQPSPNFEIYFVALKNIRTPRRCDSSAPLVPKLIGHNQILLVKVTGEDRVHSRPLNHQIYSNLGIKKCQHFFYAEDVIGDILVGHLSAHSHQHSAQILMQL